MRRASLRSTLCVVLTVVAGLVPGVARAADDPPDIYRYLEDPGLTSENQEEPHADLRPYPSVDAAVADVTEHSAANPLTRSLNGQWRLRLYERPDDVPASFHEAGFDASGWPAVSVPHTWQSDFLDHPIFRNIPTEISPDDPPRVPRDVNPTGAYVRALDIPQDWRGDRVFLRFEGVTSNYLVWINGGYVGYDQGGYTPAEFDITPYVRPGRNQIAVQVHRWGSGAYLEDVDQWRYSGIFRDVWVYRTEQTRLRDAYIVTDLDDAYRDATLRVSADVAGAAGDNRIRAILRDGRGRTVATATGPGAIGRNQLDLAVPNPDKWSAEEPNLYTLALQLLDRTGRALHTTAQPVGFREVEVRDRQILVNGERILIKGTNRSETDPDTGRHVTRAAQRRDVLLMKSLHLNAVRTSHYPSDPYLYDLADRYGLWVDDEVDIETHSHESCPDDCLADRPEWQAAFADRFRAMVERDKNHPSVIFWDTGNEAGLGAAHYAMAAWADAHEPTRLLYHQSNSPDGDAPFADVDGPRYPTPDRLEARVRSSAKPVVMGEYAHAMGNGLGNFDQFWALARRYPSLQGGFIWDWAEANLSQPLVLTPDRANGIQSFLVGKPATVDGHRGRAVGLSSLDDFVDVFRDPRLDLTGPLTLDAWVKPGDWAGSFPILTKGDAYALQMPSATRLEFRLGSASASATVPGDWYGTWHRVTGVYDGAELRLLIDDRVVGRTGRTGAVDPGLWEVNLGRNAQTQQDNDLANKRLARGVIDSARVYDSALTPAELAADPASQAVLALDFDTFQRRGEFLSLGISLSGTDGLVGSDRYLQPETAELAWAQAPLRFSYASGVVRVVNEQQAGTLDVTLKWAVAEQERTLREGSRRVVLGPGGSASLAPGVLPANPGDRERFLNVSAVTNTDRAWARRGWVVGHDQFAVGGSAVGGILPAPVAGAPSVASSGDTVTVSGRGFRYRFDRGTLASMRSGGRELLRGGPVLDVYRPPTSNETYAWGTDDRRIWHDLGLDALTTTVDDVDVREEPDAVVVDVASTVSGRAVSFDQTLSYAIDRNGTVTLEQTVVPDARAAALPYLPRVGISLRVPSSMQELAYYGRGPDESYNDRRSGSPIGVYRSTVADQYVRYSRPQAHGNHTDARWGSLTDGRTGLLVGGMNDLSVTAYDNLDRAEYDHQLPLVKNKDWVTLHALAGETGMGETPNSVLAPYRLSPTRPYTQSLVLRPLTAAEARAGGVPGSDVAAPCPPSLTLTAPDQITPGSPATVTAAVTPRCAGGLTAVSVRLSAPPGWEVSPPSGTFSFTVTPPADTDVGEYPLAAVLTAVDPGGFPVTQSASTTVSAPLPAGYGWVSDRSWTAGSNGWGPVEKDTSNAEEPAGDGNPLTLRGVVFPKGLGAHAASSITVPLGGACTRLRTSVGVDDETGGAGSVTFEVWADDTRLAATGTLTGTSPAQNLDLDITGADTLHLRVTDAGDGNGNDHADWAGTRVACTT